MEKYCEKCGGLLAEGALFCFACGTRVPQPENKTEVKENVAEEIVVQSVQPEVEHKTEQPAVQINVEPQEPTLETAEKPEKKQPKFTGKRLIALLVAAAVLLGGAVYGAVCGIIYIADSVSINSAVETYVDVVYLGEHEKLENMIPEALMENEDFASVIASNSERYDPKSVAEERSKKMDAYFGDDIVITCNVTEFDRIDGDTALLFKDIFFSAGAYNDVIDFDCLYRLTFEVNVKGSKNEATYSHYAYALDADGEWLLYGNTSFRLFFYDAWINQTELDKDIANGYTLYAGDVVF